ncbi:MAG: hypothetical protein ACREU8_04445, partial [Gammaproteobacteria bacterium]
EYKTEGLTYNPALAVQRLRSNALCGSLQANGVTRSNHDRGVQLGSCNPSFDAVALDAFTAAFRALISSHCWFQRS